MSRFIVCTCAATLLVGCGHAPNDPRTAGGAFKQIENIVGDIHTNVFGEHYSGDLGDDQMGLAMLTLQQSVKGTKLEADYDKLASKYTEVSTLASTRPPIGKLRKAVTELEEAVVDFKKKM
jgi:hypothetical protein